MKVVMQVAIDAFKRKYNQRRNLDLRNGSTSNSTSGELITISGYSISEYFWKVGGDIAGSIEYSFALPSSISCFNREAFIISSTSFLSALVFVSALPS